MDRPYMILASTGVGDYIVPLLYATEQERDQRLSEMRPTKVQIFQRLNWTKDGWIVSD